ncbi:MAG: hypothetical protein U0L20_00640 [Ruminococcus sp.]|nr:hypothetical protein [Ruminococcus sp.]
MNNDNKNRKKKIIDIEEMKAHKVKAAVYIILRLIILAVLIWSIFSGRWENTMTCVLSLVLFMIPSFIEHRMKIDLPSALEIIMIIFIFAANIMGELGSFYEKIPIWDTTLHTINGFICAGVGFGLIDILNQNEKIKIKLSPLFVCLFSFCFSMTVGTIWEFFEFSIDMFFNMDMQKDSIINTINSVFLTDGNINEITSINGITDTVVNGEKLNINGYLDIGLIDTMKDLIVNFIGAVVFNLSGYFYIKYRGKKANFITNFIPRRKSSETHTDNN